MVTTCNVQNLWLRSNACLKHTVKGMSFGNLTLNDNASDAVGVLPWFPKVHCHSCQCKCRRKAAELAGNSKGKAKAGPAAIPPGGASAAAPTSVPASDPSKFQKVPKANKGKKGKASKGQKVGNSLLGFSTKSDFSVLERGDDYA